MIGGIKGAKGQFDIDFWASSYKSAMNWLNKNSAANSKVIVAMAPDIAKLYLRDDLKKKVNPTNLSGYDSNIYLSGDYTVILNRQSFYNWYGVYPFIKNRKPVYSISVKNIHLTSIYQNN